MSLLDRWRLLKHQGTPDPWFDGTYLHLYKEGLGFNPNFTHTGSGVEAADHAYFTYDGAGSVTLAAFSIPATLSIARVYTDASMQRPQSNYLFSVLNDKTEAGSSNIITRYNAYDWNDGSTDRRTHWNSQNVLRNQVWDLTIKSNYTRARVYNFYVTLT